MQNSKNTSKKVATLGLFCAVVILLQILSYFVKIGTFNLSLVLIPIVIGAGLYGPEFGGILGLVFGLVTLIAAAIGADLGGNFLFVSSPFALIFVCLLKGFCAGFFSGLVFKALNQKNSKLTTILAAAAAPVTNTLIFCVSMPVLFKDALYNWAAGKPIFYYIIFGLVGINFLIELLINTILSPAIFRILKQLKHFK